MNGPAIPVEELTAIPAPADEGGIALRVVATTPNVTALYRLDLLVASLAVDLALHRLTRQGTIRCIARGMYDYPKTSEIVGILPPSPEAIAKALAGPEGLRLQPAGAYAANFLGLSEQVPARVVYFTDGPSRTVRIGKQTIVLKQTTPRNMELHNRVSGLVAHALRHLGRKHVGQEQIAILRRRLTYEPREALVTDAKWVPAWVAKVMRAVARED